MKKKIEVFCTLGPSSLTKDFLKFSNSNVHLLRLNMSHLDLKQLEKNILYIKRFSKIPICIDTEGAQIRTKCHKSKFFKKHEIFKVYYDKKYHFYPNEVFKNLKVNDKLDIGFNGLIVKIKNKSKSYLSCKVLAQGYFEPNKGVHVVNRKFHLNYLTDKDKEALNIGKKYKIKNYALSFTNNHKDVIRFNNLLKNENKIFKIETNQAIKNFKKIIKFGDNFLIDRGDLSKDVSIENVPIIQRQVVKIANKSKKKVYVATNFLESMLVNSYPTRAEVNDIYNTIEMGSKGLVLAAETAIGNNPKECVRILKKIISAFKKKNG